MTNTNKDGLVESSSSTGGELTDDHSRRSDVDIKSPWVDKIKSIHSTESASVAPPEMEVAAPADSQPPSFFERLHAGIELAAEISSALVGVATPSTPPKAIESSMSQTVVRKDAFLTRLAIIQQKLEKLKTDVTASADAGE